MRDAAEALIMALYRNEDRNLVRQLMPPNDIDAQRQPLLKRIFAKFDKIDGRPVVDARASSGAVRKTTTSIQVGCRL